MRDRKLVGSRQRSLSCRFILPRRERPLLAGNPSLRPLIDKCQKCSTSPANHEPRSPANGSFQNPGVCPQAVPSFPSPTPTVVFLALAPFSAQAKYRKPRSSVFLCSQTLRKRLLRRLTILGMLHRNCLLCRRTRNVQ